MREIERILDELRRAHNGDPWHGPSLRAALDGVDARQAMARPEPAAHTIAEIVLHVRSWTREVTRRLRVGTAQNPADGDWPVASVANDREWAALLASLDAANAELQEVVAGLEEAELDERIGDARDRSLGSGVSRYVTVHGLAQHHAYHAGQISLLKRALDHQT
jgi:uncharacterized damage-inducible protein DinB